MASAPKIKKDGKAHVNDRVNKAKGYYLGRMGQVSDVEMSKKFGVHRNTIKKWKDKGEWDKLVAETQQKVDLTTAKKAADFIVEQADQVYTEIFTNLRLATLVCRKKLLKHDDHDRPLVGSDGQPAVNTELSAGAVRSLCGSMAEYFKMVRLHTGQTTDNQGRKHSGEVKNRHTAQDAAFDKAISKIVDTGDIDGQDALALMIENQQRIISQYDDDADDC